MNDEELIKCLVKSSELKCSQCLQYYECNSDDCEKVIAEKALDLINRQQERIEELEIITGLANNRKYYRKFVDEIFCKQKGNELSEPDFDYIYQLYFEQQAVIDDLKRDTVPKLQDSLERANKYGRATDEENARLKAEIEKFKNAIKEADQLFSEGFLYDGLAIVARLAIEIERGEQNV